LQVKKIALKLICTSKLIN